MNTTHWVAV